MSSEVDPSGMTISRGSPGRSRRVDLLVDPPQGAARRQRQDDEEDQDDREDPPAARRLSAQLHELGLVLVLLVLVVVLLVLVGLLVRVEDLIVDVGVEVGVLQLVGVSVVHRRGSSGPALSRRWSSQACSMTAAATLSTTRRRAPAFMSRAIRSRSAVTVVRRSSQISTGSPVAAASSSASASAAAAAGPDRAVERQRQADDEGHGAGLLGQRGDGAVVASARSPDAGHHLVRRGQRARRSWRAATPIRFDPRSMPSALTSRWMPAAARTVTSAASMPSASLPPATARSGSFPPPPLISFLASSRSAEASSPLSGRDGGHQRRPAALGRGGEHDGPQAVLVAQREREVAEGVSLEAVDSLDHHAVDRLGRERSPAWPPAAWRFSALTSSRRARDLLEALAGAVDDLAHGHVEHLGQLGQPPLLLAEPLDRARAGDGLDAAEVGADGRLRHDLHRADVAEGPDVGAAAQLDRVPTRLEHADDVAVLVAEEGDGAEVGGLGLGGLVVAHRVVGEDLGVGEVLDLLDLRRR